MPVDVVHFNPMRRAPGWGRLLPSKPLNNFGDLLGPIIVAQMVERLGLQEPSEHRRMAAVGSIMKMTRPGDVVWGTGINGKSLDVGAAPDIDVRAVRGPRTRRVLEEHGVDVPEVYGDPALLWSTFWPREHYLRENSGRSLHEVTVVPNLYDYRPGVSPWNVVNPRDDAREVIRQIALSDFVCGSSLHGIVLAESFGIPARLIQPGVEPSFKYEDYYGGTGREGYSAARTVDQAVELGGEPPVDFDADALMAAFPADLWNGSASE